MILSGYTAIVTGGSRGIGAAIAEALVASGAHVVITSRSPGELSVTKERLSKSGVVESFCCDVSSREQVSELATFVRCVVGDPHIVVNNAGIQGPIGRLDRINLDAFWTTLRINLGGVVHCSRAFLPAMIRRRHGKIINIAGGGATAPRQNFSAYAVSKVAIARLTENLALELMQERIDVNAVAPGFVDTRFQDEIIAAGAEAGPELEKIVTARRERSHFVPAATAAALVVFLASNEANGLTGKLISAPHDPWRDWSGKGPQLSSSPLYTLRRLDPFTIRPLKDVV
jgi:3-oxoacyl-[acyl-carrier protein] reductase